MFLEFIARQGDSSGAFVLVSLFMIFVWIVLLGILIGATVLWFITVIHAISHEDAPDRVLWIVLHFVIGVIIGPIYYFAVQKPYEKKHHKPHVAKK